MTKKLKRVLPDTVIIIDAHEHGYWEPLCNTYHLLVPKTILENEAFYFQSDWGKVGMNPTEWIKQGKVESIEATLEEFQILNKKLSSDFMASLDPGELEALAILLSKNHKDVFFTTADRAPVKALGVLSLGFKGISVEELLTACGVKRKDTHKIPERFTKKWFQQALTEGFGEQHLWLK